ncbi:uncharacterized protein BDZ99DRAFT_160714 [Mytilinidion resinicola]|uniref:UDENN FLCN/SMCR8-type domain-containing protein n=1 Tax=Mytilinidion resinicola TaxID=574789 RepID=A0A6A6Y4D1_9PEZI|nr:uncharacterized protein BDZ99DRAFT_160714 [Mytilinidion resinicola]KAF2803701.1 hypothetical protein BDZ99DRAFT_160714 [Mytilinidion resinicola]
MDFTISLAHFCEVHGPTPILCTQISPPDPCQTCHHPCVTPPSDEPPRSAHPYNALYDNGHGSLASRLPQLSSPFETPPTSPTSPRSRHNPYFPSVASGTDFTRRYSGSVEDENDSCANCTFLVPKNVSQRLPDGAPGSPSKDGRGKSSSPVLRTNQPVLARGPATPQSDEYNSSPESSDAEQSKSSTASRSSLPNSSPSSPMYMPRNTHTHTLTYLTTHQPTSPSTFSLLRRSCIRTLSCEMLPCGKPSGPLYFGDPIVGYTIAYIFRLPDPRARGQKRTYALIALGGRDSWRVGKAMVKVTAVFESIANRIIAMADKVLERESAASPFNQPLAFTRPSTAVATTPPLLSTSAQSMPAFPSPQKEKLSFSTASSPATRNITPVSSFLSAKKVDPDGYPRVSRDVMRAKSLAEIVGREDFFVELHVRFCTLLSSLIKEFGT